MSSQVNAAHGDNQTRNWSILGVIGTLGTADVKGSANTLPFSVNPTTGAAYVNSIDLGPLDNTNPSLVVSYNAAGDAVKLEKTIGSTTYTKTFTRSDNVVASTLPISVWS